MKNGAVLGLLILQALNLPGDAGMHLMMLNGKNFTYLYLGIINPKYS
jgi:hypothetical protein